MEIKEALTFDDVLLVPNKSNILPNEANTQTLITNRITLNSPIMSSAMDTVTESRMAIALAQYGGIGVIHRNLKIKEQVACVNDVKRFESAIVYNPITLRENQKLSDAKDLQKKLNITGFPVVNEKNILKGILTNRDMRFVENLETPVSEMMTDTNLAIVNEPVSNEKARSILSERRIEKLLIINKNNELVGLMTVKDLENSVLNPLATKDSLGRLRVGAASTVGQKGLQRSMALIEAGADLIVIDTAHGHSSHVLKSVEELRNKFPDIDIVAGNVATQEATRALIKAGANAVKVGIGPGSICTTRIVAGVGVPQFTALLECAEEADKHGKVIIADGGIKYSGDFAKAIAAGASCVMVGSLLAGTDEAPGEVLYYQGRSVKNYRGMGSVGAMARGSADRYFQKEVEADKLIPEGIEGHVPYKGPVGKVLHQLLGGLKAAMGYTGNQTIDSMKKNCSFVKITNAGLRESHVHDVSITRQAPNYFSS